MRRKCFAVFAIAAGLFFSIGCGESTNEHTKILNNTEASEKNIEAIRAEETESTEEEAEERLVYSGAAYTWQEVSVTIPQAWDGKFALTEEPNGFSVYQIASNQIDSALGFLCGIYRTEEYSNLGAGEQLLAYTDEGVLYYMVQPTDVTCYTEDEAIAGEYNEMMQYVDWLAESVQVSGTNVHQDANQFAIPVSSIMPLEAHHLVNLSNNDLWIARNEIYARHGKIFQNAYLASYFNSCSWYQPQEGKNDVSERELNEVEIANIKLILEAEAAYTKEYPYPQQYITGKATKVPLSGTDSQNVVLYEVSQEDSSDGAEISCQLTIDGTVYDLYDYVLMDSPVQDVFYITDIAYYDERLEIAVLDNGPSDDPITHFFQYDGELQYIGYVSGFPFKAYGNNGFSSQNGIIGTGRTDLIETAYIDAYFWYDSSEGSIEPMELTSYNYKWYHEHELYVDLEVYCCMDANAPTRTLKAQKQVFFIETDGKEWILVRGKDGTEGYIRVEDGQIVNIGLPAEEVFSELYFFG